MPKAADDSRKHYSTLLGRSYKRAPVGMMLRLVEQRVPCHRRVVFVRWTGPARAPVQPQLARDVSVAEGREQRMSESQPARSPIELPSIRGGAHHVGERLKVGIGQYF